MKKDQFIHSGIKARQEKAKPLGRGPTESRPTGFLDGPKDCRTTLDCLRTHLIRRNVFPFFYFSFEMTRACCRNNTEGDLAIWSLLCPWAT